MITLLSPILSFLGLLLLFYPVIPTLALIALLWVRPHEADSKVDRISKAIIGNTIKKEPLSHTVSKEIKYRQMDFFVTIAHAIGKPNY